MRHVMDFRPSLACFPRFFIVLFLATPAFGLAVETAPGEQLAKLKKPNAEERLNALRELQTSLDPQLPEALLPLLADEGNSIRRVAARAVGSRWWQIPKERVPVFLKALERNEKSELEDEVNMVHRAQGLLRREYRGNMFQRSPNHRWVIYERHGLPCLIDTKTGSEELVGWREGDAASLDAAWGNETLEKSVLWHGGGNMAAMSIVRGRKESAVWFWRHRGEVQKVEQEAILKVLGVRPESVLGGGGFFTEIKGWKTDELRFEASFSVRQKEDSVDRTAMLAFNPVKKTLRVISR